MRIVHKLCACLVREGSAGPELLVFDHPQAGTQIPKGTLEEGESHREGVLRELAEETGVRDVEIVRSVGTWRRRPVVEGRPELHTWEVFELRPTAPLADEWIHPCEGSEAERGLMLRCHWIALDLFALEALHPVFGHVIEMLLTTRDRP
jgi:8-oxo-dGTP pyrophosphatase MutT (NUDIX family)